MRKAPLPQALLDAVYRAIEQHKPKYFDANDRLSIAYGFTFRTCWEHGPHLNAVGLSWGRTCQVQLFVQYQEGSPQEISALAGLIFRISELGKQIQEILDTRPPEDEA